MSGSALEWRREAREEWNEQAASTSRVTLLPDEKAPTRIRVEGPCPACGHETAHGEPLRLLSVSDAVPAVTRALRRPERRSHATFEVLCDCGTEHDDAPEGGIGCGRSWTLTVRW